MKLELHINYTKPIQIKENETINWIENDDEERCYCYMNYINNLVMNIGRTEYLETENSAILNFIKWVDNVWMPFVKQHTDTSIPKEKYDEWDKICSEFEKAITAETGYSFTTIENEHTDEPTISCVLVKDSIYWEY